MEKIVDQDAGDALRQREHRRRMARKIVGALLILLALAFLARMLVPELDRIREAATSIRWPQIAAAMLALVPMCLLKARYHFYLLERLNGEPVGLRAGLPVYLQAQIVRYLPGSIWGMVYQSQRMAGTHRASEVVIANLWQMATTNLLAVCVVASLLLGWNLSPWWLLLLLPSVALIEVLHRYPVVESWGLKRLARLMPSYAPLAAGRALPPMRWNGTALLCAEWLFYLLAFVLLVDGFISWPEATMLGAWYSGASVISLLAFVVPAGIAVREAVFVAAPQMVGVGAAELAVVAVLARATSLGADVAAAALASLAALGSRDEQA